MIYCVRFSDVVRHLNDLGFTEAARNEIAVVFGSDRGRRVVIRPPNQDGNVPEILINDAFDAAGLTPPAWNVFWCD